MKIVLWNHVRRLDEWMKINRAVSHEGNDDFLQSPLLSFETIPLISPNLNLPDGQPCLEPPTVFSFPLPPLFDFQLSLL